MGEEKWQCEDNSEKIKPDAVEKKETQRELKRHSVWSLMEVAQCGVPDWPR